MIARMWKAAFEFTVALIRDGLTSVPGRLVLVGFAVTSLMRADAIKDALRVDGLTVLAELVEPAAWAVLLGVIFVLLRDACAALIWRLPKNQLRSVGFDAESLQREIEMGFEWSEDRPPSGSLFVSLKTMKTHLSRLGIASPEIARNRDEWYRFLVNLQVWAADGDIDAARRQR